MRIQKAHLKIIHLALGIVSIYVGFRITREGWLYLYGVPTPSWSGYVFMIFGLFYVLSIIKK